MKLLAAVSTALTCFCSWAFAQCAIPSQPPKSSTYSVQTLSYEVVDSGPVMLDLYLPNNVVTPPLVVLVHGGGWSAGSRTLEAKNAAYFTSFGYAAASVDYRLAAKNGVNLFPAAVQDVRCAVRWLRANAALLGVNGTNIGAYGGSAGGNLVGMLGAAAQASGDLDGSYCPIDPLTASASVQVVADYYGLNDGTDAAAFNALQLKNFGRYLGVNPLDDPDISVLGAADYYVDANTPPFIIVRGTADNQMPENQSLDLANALQAAGSPYQYFDVDGLKHGFSPFATKQFPQLLPSACAMLAAFSQYLNPPPPPQ